MHLVTGMVATALLIALAAVSVSSRSIRCCWWGHHPLHPEWQSRCKRCGLDAWQQEDDEPMRVCRWVALAIATVALAWAVGP